MYLTLKCKVKYTSLALTVTQILTLLYFDMLVNIIINCPNNNENAIFCHGARCAFLRPGDIFFNLKPETCELAAQGMGKCHATFSKLL